MAMVLVSGCAMLISQRALAQYPQIPTDVKQESDARRAAADKRSDDSFDKAKAVIAEWEKKGKPYIPWASKPTDLPQSGIPAFPGAEGGGMYSVGGRGGKVFVVTSLEDSGPGTFREACEAGGPRIVVFNVAGIIRLKDRVRIRAPYITIAGNTAPGDGVCIAGGNVSLDTHDVIIRHMRFRRGETWVGDRDDSIGGNPIGNIMIDHVSASWGLDENMSMYRHMYAPPDGSKELKLPTANITIQNSIFAEGLNTYHHAFGSTIGGTNDVFHHNLWACNTGRNPSIGMGGDFNYVNNVIFNWVHRTTDGGDNTSRVNSINNYFKPGPATPKDRPIAYRIIKPESARSREKTREFGQYYVTGNIVEGNEKVTADNWAGGVQFADAEDTGGRSVADYSQQFLEKSRASSPFPMARVTIQPTKEAYETVLANVGAILPRRDAVDERVVKMVRSGQVTAKPARTDELRDILTKVKFTSQRIDEIIALINEGIITHPDQVGGYPQYQGTPYKDSDNDGMPDEWETRYGLNPNDATDAAKDMNGDGYTNIEKYIYGIDPTKKIDWSDPKNNVDPLMTGKLQASN
jgi:hypothetical protein